MNSTALALITLMTTARGHGEKGILSLGWLRPTLYCVSLHLSHGWNLGLRLFLTS